MSNGISIVDLCGLYRVTVEVFLIQRVCGIFGPRRVWIHGQGMLDRIIDFGLVAMLLIDPSKPNIGLVLLRIERHGLLETLDGFGDVSAEHLRSYQVLPAEAGPHARIFAIECNGLGSFFFYFRAELGTREHRVPQ